MAEPTYVRQRGDVPLDMHERTRWYTECAEEAMRDYGCTFFRHSYDPDNPQICLVEGWTEFELKQGEPRFSMQMVG